MSVSGLTGLELASKFLGWWSLGLSWTLFIPEIWHLMWTRPTRLAPDVFGFYVAWLIGDGGQLLGLYLGEGLLTQKILAIGIASFEIVILIFSMLFAGIFVCKPCRQPRRAGLMASAAATHTHPDVRYEDALPPPGYSRLPHEIAEMFGLDYKELKGWRKWLSKLFMPGLVLASVVAMTIVWYIEAFSNEHAEADPVSSKPSTGTAWAAWAVSWLGFVCWVGPRIFNIIRSRKRNEAEGITLPAVMIGGGGHTCNILSILLINHDGGALIAQAAFILTSLFCVVIDVYRVFLKRSMKGKDPTVPPADDPKSADGKWVERRRLSASSDGGHLSSDAGRHSSHAGQHFSSDGEHLSPSEIQRRQHHWLTAFIPTTFDARFPKDHPVNVARVRTANKVKLWEFNKRCKELDRLLELLKEHQRQSIPAEEAFAHDSRHAEPHERHRLELPLDKRFQEEAILQGKIDALFAGIPRDNHKQRDTLVKCGINKLLQEDRNLSRELQTLRDQRHGHKDSSRKMYGRLVDSDFSPADLSLSDPAMSSYDDERKGSDSSLTRGLRQTAGRVRGIAKRSTRKEKKSDGA
ncbi:hypothetical protein JCM10207_002132 [Rhodosporidiobolus poonsookiae]